MPDRHEAFAFVGLLKDCAKKKDLQHGSALHADILERRILHGKSGPYVGSALISMYAKCGALAKAQEVLETLPVRNVVSWNALIEAYVECGYGEEALTCLKYMQLEGFSPSGATFACSLKACGCIGAVEKGRYLHLTIERLGLLQKDVQLCHALVEMYVKCGFLTKAYSVFEDLPYRDTILWNVLIAGYCYMDRGEDALNSFKRMQCKYGLSPDAVTFASILKACGSICATQEGMKIHADIVKRGLLENNNVLGTALLDMYAKCAMVTEACQVFDELHCQNIISWTALISGYSQIGNYAAVFNLFHKMMEEGLVPNYVTFIVMLNACSYSGLDNEGEMYFDYITKVYGIIPASEHYTCMVGLFGRMGHFDKAMESINKLLPFEHLPAWYALLTACRNWGNLNLGRLVFKQMH